jgi:lysophospholipase L1-like esterase
MGSRVLVLPILMLACSTAMFACVNKHGTATGHAQQEDETADAGSVDDATVTDASEDARDQVDGSHAAGDASDPSALDAKADDAGASDAGDDAAMYASMDAGADAGADAGRDAGPPAVRLLGRFDTSVAGKAVVQWPGARILAQFQGTGAKVTLGDHANAGENGYWDVSVDGTLSPTPIKMTEGTATYTVASGLPDTTHTLEFFRRNEPYVDTTTFLGFDFGAGALLPPEPAPDRRLEFLGDSASSGYGIDGAGPNCNFSALTENDRHAYPWLTAKALGADHHNLSYQGRGVYWNYQRSDPTHYGALYARTLPLSAGSVWSYPSYVPGVVWITLGGNDYDMPNVGDPPPPFAGFKAAYDALVTQVRTAHPSAIIICSVTPDLNDSSPAGYNAYTSVATALTQVVTARNAGGDAKVHYFEFTRSVAADVTGCNYHPNAAKNASMAQEATAFIKSKTGW